MINQCEKRLLTFTLGFWACIYLGLAIQTVQTWPRSVQISSTEPVPSNRHLLENMRANQTSNTEMLVSTNSNFHTMHENLGALHEDLGALHENLSGMHHDLTTLNTDMVKINAGLSELLDRLPAPHTKSGEPPIKTSAR